MIFFTSDNISRELEDNTVSTSNIVDSSITTAKIDNDAVTSIKLSDDSIETAKIVDGAVTIAKLASGITYVLDREGQQVVSNTTDETTVFSYLVAANLLSTNKMIRLTMIFDLYDSSGNNSNFTFKIKFGTTTLWGATNQIVGNSVVRKAGKMVIELANQDNTAIQVLGGVININSVATTGVTNGIGSFVSTDQERASIQGTATESTTVDKTFSVTIAMQTANASTTFRKQYAVLELI